MKRCKDRDKLELIRIHDFVYYFYEKRKKISLESAERIEYIIDEYEYDGENIEYIDEIHRLLDCITDYNDYGTKLELMIKSVPKQVDKDIINYEMVGLLC